MYRNETYKQKDVGAKLNEMDNNVGAKLNEMDDNSYQYIE